LFSFPFYFLPKYAPPPTIWSLLTFLFKRCYKVIVFFFTLSLVYSFDDTIMIVVVTATEEAETTEYGEDFAARVYWIEESWSGKCVFLADMDVKDDSGSRNCFS